MIICEVLSSERKLGGEEITYVPIGTVLSPAKLVLILGWDAAKQIVVSLFRPYHSSD
jgi:hypothetical protein